MKSGKKSYATNIIYNNGFFLARYLNKSLYNIYSEIFIRLRPFIEIRKVRVRRTTYMVPFPTNSMRQYYRSEEHTSELQSRPHLVCRLLLEKKKNKLITYNDRRRNVNSEDSQSE